MNWDAIGAIAELLGAAAVLITLIYLAVQIRHVREQNQSNALAPILAALQDFAGRIAESESLASIITRGRESYSSLNAEEKLRFDSIHYFYLNNMESWYVQRDQIYGITPEQSVANINGNIEAVCDHPGFWEFWTSTRDLYPHLRELVDGYFSRKSDGEIKQA